MWSGLGEVPPRIAEVIHCYRKVARIDIRTEDVQAAMMVRWLSQYIQMLVERSTSPPSPGDAANAVHRLRAVLDVVDLR